jgi:hypothetical protein
MPSFFEGMRRLIAGEQVYRPGEDTDAPIYQHKDEAKSEAQATVANYDHDAPVIDPVSRDKAHPPEAVIERFECYYHDGSHMEINLFIANHSNQELLIDKVMLFGHRHDIDFSLHPGQSREFMVYRGPLMDNHNYTTAELHYRTPAGDYFSAMHNIEYEEKFEHKYVPHRIRFYGPVKDI